MSATAEISSPARRGDDRLSRRWTSCEGSVIIPAHEEAAVIGRTLSALGPLAAAGRLEVVVSCNGCTDATADIARSFEGVVVLETGTPSKVAALNAADAVARSWPRLYLDADVEMSYGDVRALFAVLRGDSPTRAARPAVRYDTEGAPFLVRSYYRARLRSSSTALALWGAGAYAMSEAGRKSFEAFPAVTADDLFVDGQFDPDAKEVVSTASSVVRTPRTLDGLLSVLRRTYRGNTELVEQVEVPSPGEGWRSSLRTLLASTRGISDVGDSAVYLGLSLLGRVLAARAGSGSTVVWERDASSREPGARGLLRDGDAGHEGFVLDPRRGSAPSTSGRVFDPGQDLDETTRDGQRL